MSSYIASLGLPPILIFLGIALAVMSFVGAVILIGRMNFVDNDPRLTQEVQELVEQVQILAANIETTRAGVVGLTQQMANTNVSLQTAHSQISEIQEQVKGAEKAAQIWVGERTQT